MSPEILQTCDLRLKPISASDAVAFASLQAKSDMTPESGQQQFQRLLTGSSMQVLLLETRAGQELIGFLDWIDPCRPFVEIVPGRRLLGYASQAFDRVSRFREDQSDLRIEIEHDPTVARLLLEKCGYQLARGQQCHYTISKGSQRQLILDQLDVRYRQAYRDQVFAIHQGLGIDQDYADRHQLELTGEATALCCIGDDIYDRSQFLEPDAATAWLAMTKAADEDGESLQPVSAYRSIHYQEAIIHRKLDAGITIPNILKVSAAPGYSEHHTGRALDLTTPGSATLEEEFESTSAFAWLANNASRFGFHLSYPRNNRHQIAYEPWHWAFDPSRDDSG